MKSKYLEDKENCLLKTQQNREAQAYIKKKLMHTVIEQVLTQWQ